MPQYKYKCFLRQENMFEQSYQYSLRPPETFTIKQPYPVSFPLLTSISNHDGKDKINDLQ